MNEWKQFFDQLLERLRSPAESPTFVLYFTAVTMGVGGLGHWIALLNHYFAGVNDDANLAAVASNLGTYALAIGAASFADVMLRGDQQRAVKMFMLALFLVALALGSVAVVLSGSPVSVVLAFLAALVGLILWWLVNAENRDLREPPPDAATGGDPHTDLQGDLEGIKA